MVKQIQTLYDYLYQMLISQFLNGTFQPGQPFPSQRVLCQRYNAGITTVRKVMKMLDEEGYVRTVKGQPSIVTYQASPETYAGFLVQGRDEIADAYKGLELLMPIFYREGARRCRAPELRLLHGLTDRISDHMEHEELYRQAHAFYAVLLRPLNNLLIMDLEVDSEHFLYTPYIPLPGTKNPFTLTAARLKNWMYDAVCQIEHRQFDDFYNKIVNDYRESAKRVDGYLHSLSRHIPAPPQVTREIHWFHTKGRSELYARLAMTIIRRIDSGEFDSQKYLPSIPRLMEEYGVMKNTASRAVSLLNHLGFARTLDKKGTVIAIKENTAGRENIDLAAPIIQERLTLFMNALQIISLTARNCAASFSSIPEDLLPFMERRLMYASDSRVSPLSIQPIMKCFVQMIPCHSLKNIFQQMEELIIWGYYLQAVDPVFSPDSCCAATAMKELAAALRTQDQAVIANAYGNAFTLVYEDVCRIVSQIPGCSCLLPDRQ